MGGDVLDNKALVALHALVDGGLLNRPLADVRPFLVARVGLLGVRRLPPLLPVAGELLKERGLELGGLVSMRVSMQLRSSSLFAIPMFRWQPAARNWGTIDDWAGAWAGCGNTHSESRELRSSLGGRLGNRRALVFEDLLVLGVDTANQEGCAGGSGSDVEPHFGEPSAIASRPATGSRSTGAQCKATARSMEKGRDCQPRQTTQWGWAVMSLQLEERGKSPDVWQAAGVVNLKPGRRFLTTCL